MKRSKHQAVYKYLPGVWAAFNDREVDKLNSNSVTIQIDKWNYRALEGIFTQRITAEIARQIKLFYRRGGGIVGFNIDSLEDELLYVEPAMIEGIPDIIGDISPLTFYCRNCKSTFSYSDSRYISKNTWKCQKCGKNDIRQLQMIYSCECGAANPVKLPYKIINGQKVEYKYNPVDGREAYKFYYYNKGKEIKEEMVFKCQCNKWLIPSNASDGKNFRPFDVKTINLIDKRQGIFYKKGIDSQRIIIANWLGLISDEKYEEILQNIDDFFNENSDIENSKEFIKKVEEYIDIFELEEEEAKEKAKKALLKSNNNKNSGVQREIEKQFPNLSFEQIEVIASQILEYNTLKSSKRIITINEAIENQLELGVIQNKSDILKVNEQYGIANAQVSQDIEIITSTFGYTRKVKDPEKVSNGGILNLKPFRNEQNKNIVYCSVLETEGIVIELDKKKILGWLYENKVISQENMPDMEDELSIKKWFIENIKSDKITPFSDLDMENPEMKITYYVYNLIHTISHALLKNAGILSGLEKNSLSEMIFPNLATIFIYANTTQGIPLGALSGMFEQNYKSFIIQAEDIMGRCVFDPICMDRDNGSCSACTQLSEISCCHFNKDLNRKLLIGHKTESESIIGFWN